MTPKFRVFYGDVRRGIDQKVHNVCGLHWGYDGLLERIEIWSDKGYPLPIWVKKDQFEIIRFTGYQDSAGTDLWEGDLCVFDIEPHLQVEVVFNRFGQWVFRSEGHPDISVAEHCKNVTRVKSKYEADKGKP